MFEELRKLRNAALRLFLAFFLLLGIFLFAPFVKGITVTAYVVGLIQEHLVPAGVSLIVLSPLDPFFTQATIAAMLAVGCLIPLLALEAWFFLAPALIPSERSVLAGGLLTGFLCAIGGATFSLLILTPLMFNELFTFLPQGVEPFFSLQKTVSVTASLTLACAFLFLIPVVMALASLAGLVPAAAWKIWARPAILLVLIASAIITPDGSGVGMVLLALPLSALYALGGIASTVLEKRRLSTNT